jgi:hypothetical protein
MALGTFGVRVSAYTLCDVRHGPPAVHSHHVQTRVDSARERATHAPVLSVC